MPSDVRKVYDLPEDIGKLGLRPGVVEGVALKNGERTGKS
jgi:hypothetical protein